MCGLVGLIDFKNHSRDYMQEIKIMLSKIRHRGPDNSKIGKFANFCYGFNRLSIIDISDKGNQPFEDNYTISMANCEIYNYKNLKKKFNLHSNKFTSKCDAEIIPILYKISGINLLKELDGMFSFALFDKQKKITYLARDRIGIKPLYYYYDNNYFIFSSEIKSLICLSFIDRNINNQILNNYLISGFGDIHKSFIEKVKILPPGSYIKVADNEISINKYYERPTKFINFNNQREILEEFDFTLTKSINSHLISDVPTALLLSKGKDSNIIKSKINNKYLKTFTLGADNFDKNEIFLDNNKFHKNLKVDFNLFNNLENSFIHAMDQPTVDGLNTYIITKLISDNGYKVVLSGLGADELLGGYGSFKFLPKIYNSKINSLSITKLLYFINFLFNYERSNKIKKLWNAKKFENIYSVFRDYSLFDECIQIKNIFRNKKIYSNNNDEFFETGWRYSQELEIINYLQKRLLPDSDVFSMANSIELRVPFLSNKLIDLCLGIDFNKFKSLSHPKKILNILYYNNIDKNVFNKKQGFALPMNDWLKTQEFKDKILESFNNHSLMSINKNFKNTMLSVWKNFEANKIGYEIVWKYYVLDRWVKINKINLI